MGANGKRANGKGRGGARPPTEPQGNDRPKATDEAQASAPVDATSGEPPASEADEARAAVDDDGRPPSDAKADMKPAAARPAAGKAGATPSPVDTTPRALGLEGARWAAPLVKLDARWTWLETRLITFVLLWQLTALVAWVVLNGISESVSQSAGVVFRAVLGGVALGCLAWFAGRRLPLPRRRGITIFAITIGLALAPLARASVLEVAAARAGAGAEPSDVARAVATVDRVSIAYFDNIKGWLQGGSTLTLMGGLRGLGTRLTLWLALLGGSIATGAGKHIHIDVVYRFLPRKLRVPAALVNYAAATLVCFAGVWGFFDHIAIEYFGSRADDARSAKVAMVAHGVSDHLFLTRKQLALDLRSAPRVLSGERYDRSMTAAAWNRWIDEAGFVERFGEKETKNLRVPEDSEPHPPLVLSPTGEATAGMLAHTLGLVFPFGLLAIGLRFLLRALLTLSGNITVDPDEAHREEVGGEGAPERARSVAEGGA
jgi:Tripartite ATP-independent periplasmic transporters, DctQ component